MKNSGLPVPNLSRRSLLQAAGVIAATNAAGAGSATLTLTVA